MKLFRPRNASRSARPENHRATTRLEMFSDIVIGFSLAETGLNLVMPAHAIEFATHPAGVFAFIVTFVFVVRFWSFNNTIFERYFEPNRIMTVVNFVALAGLILQVFSLQIYLHFVPLNEGVVASRIYFAFFALGYGMQGILLGLGLLYRRRVLSGADIRRGLREFLQRTGLVVGCIVGNITASNDISKIYVQSGPGYKFLAADFPSSIVGDAFLGTLIGLGVWLIAQRFLLRREPPQEPAQPLVN